MAETDLFLRIEGQVSVADFIKANALFHKLLTEICKYVDRESHFQWDVQDLRPGSATTVFRGATVGQENIHEVETIYADV